MKSLDETSRKLFGKFREIRDIHQLVKDLEDENTRLKSLVRRVWVDACNYPRRFRITRVGTLLCRFSGKENAGMRLALDCIWCMMWLKVDI
jgi:hypothetical protein